MKYKVCALVDSTVDLNMEDRLNEHPPIHLEREFLDENPFIDLKIDLPNEDLTI